MALFSKKKNTAEAKPAVVKEEKQRSSSGLKRDVSHVLKHSRITEKATLMHGMSIYAFNVATSSTKRDIADAVKQIYNVTPRKIAIVQVPQKQTRSSKTGKRGVKIGGKKAYVYLKQGETITII